MKAKNFWCQTSNKCLLVLTDLDTSIHAPSGSGDMFQVILAIIGSKIDLSASRLTYSDHGKRQF